MSKLLVEEKMDQGGVRVFNDRPDFPFYEVTQVHGKEVLNALTSHPKDEADGLFCHHLEKLDRPLAIKTADCLPITLIGDGGVAHLHAGWRGLQLEIHNHPKVSAIAPYEIFIGPSIHQKSYEVGREFYEHFKGREDFFEEMANQKLLFDLPGCAKAMLTQSYPHAQISLSSADTFSTPGHNSFRKDQTTTRNYNLYFPQHLW